MTAADSATAAQVGRRKARVPAILIIDARRAHDASIRFYHGNEQVWLADIVPAEFIHHA